MIAKTPSDIENLRKAGNILSATLKYTSSLVREGVTTAVLDIAAEEYIRGKDAVPAFLGYKPDGASFPYPAALCVSINDEVVHGIPSEERFLKGGDVVTLDLGLSYQGLFVDSAITMCVGVCDVSAQKLLTGTREALGAAIGTIRPGAHIGDIGAMVEVVAKKYSLTVIDELGGHALGKSVHEKPFIPNVGSYGQGEKIVEGMVLAIEPIFSERGRGIVLGRDAWTYRTKNGSRAAHFEHTVLVTKNGSEILTA